MDVPPARIGTRTGSYHSLFWLELSMCDSCTGVKSVYGALGFWRASEYVWGFFKVASGCALSGAEPLFSVLGALRAVTPEHCFVR